MDGDKKTHLALLGARLGIGAIFLVSAFGKLTGWSHTVAYAGSKGVPETLLALATALELLGALSLLLGWKTRWGGAALLVFLVPVTLVFHAFWAARAPEVQMQTVNFLKNVAIAGGLLAMIGVGPGRLSVDGWLARARGGRRTAVAVPA